MANLPQISDSEYEIMKVIWEQNPISTNDICIRVEPLRGWNSKTVHTLLTRLYHKKAVTYEKKGRMFYYSPLIQKDDYLSHETHSFLNRFYNGEMAPMLSKFLSEEPVSTDELQELSNLILSKMSKKQGMTTIDTDNEPVSSQSIAEKEEGRLS